MIPADHLTPESRANNINTMGLAIKVQNVASLLPDSVFDLFLWHKPLARTTRTDWHRLSLHTSFHMEFLHQLVKYPDGSASSSITDTTKQQPDPWGEESPFCSFPHCSQGRRMHQPRGRTSLGHLLCCKDSICRERHRVGCAASGADWGPDAALITCSCKLPSQAQWPPLISHLPVVADKTRRKMPSLDEFQHLNVFAGETKTGQ